MVRRAHLLSTDVVRIYILAFKVVLLAHMLGSDWISQRTEKTVIEVTVDDFLYCLEFWPCNVLSVWIGCIAY